MFIISTLFALALFNLFIIRQNALRINNINNIDTLIDKLEYDHMLLHG